MRAHRRLFFLTQLLTLTFLPCSAFTQSPDTGRATLSPETTVLHVGTQLVIVDVTVQDKSGHPVHGLKREDFTLTENKQPQTVSHFDEHSSQIHAEAGPELPPMPPGTFTNYTAVPPRGTLNILLLDSLNTPMSDQSYVRYELQQFIKKVNPGTRIAIFGLSKRLFLLQGFSSDPQVLKSAVDHKLVPRSSSLLDESGGNTPENASDIASNSPVGDPAAQEIASSLQEFEAEESAVRTQLRIQYTLDAFNTLAHYLWAFPGRKNVIWFSGSFPMNILPDPSLNSGVSIMDDNNPEFLETANLLSRAQIAVYPVDARGLMTDPTFSTSAQTISSFRTPSSAFYQSQASEQTTMNQLAENTGGTAFYNNNNLAAAVQNVIDSGSNYYTLTYSPTNSNSKNTYREIRAALSGNLQPAGYQLSYRHGYYIDDRNHPSKNSAMSSTTTENRAPTGSGDIYARAAMAHGAPTPEDILFKVRVLPVGMAPESMLAQANKTDSVDPIKPPFRRFAVDIGALSNAFQLTSNKDGRHAGAIEFQVLLYDNDGRLLNTAGETIELNLTPEGYKRFISGVNAHFEISVPVKGSNDFLRIGVHDIPSNRFGVVEIPIASVARLTPLPAAPAIVPASVPARTTTQDVHPQTP
jgi:VWFA-related protein